MRRRTLLVILSILAPLPFAGCSKQAEGEQTAQRPPVAVETALAERRDVVESIDVVGTLAAKFASDVRSEYTGTVTEVAVTEWVPVSAGAVLARLDTREPEAAKSRAAAAVEAARAASLQADVAAARAVREHERTVKLREVGLATQQALDEATTALEAGKAGVAAAQAQFRAAQEDLRQAETRLEKLVIRSPIAGVVAARFVNPGNLVGDPGSSGPLFRIVDPRRLDLTVDVPARRVGAVHPGDAIEFHSDGEAQPASFTGAVRFVNPAVDEASRTVRVIAEVPNDPPALRPGTFVRGRILTGSSSVLQVPRRALMGWDVDAHRAEVYVVAQGVAKKRTVTTGRASGDAIEIAAGLAAGDAVVSRGGFNLHDGDRVSVTRSAAE